jgi:hypothetical protein
MQKIIVAEVPERNEGTFVVSAEAALNDAKSWGTISDWHWGDPVTGNGQTQTSTPGDAGVNQSTLAGAIDRLRGEVADALEGVATSIRGDD